MSGELDIIIRKLQSGDENFYKSVFYDYYARLTFFANKYVHDLEIAREIVQDLFVKLYERRFNLHIETNFKSYLYRSVYNSCINHINQVAVREHHHQVIKNQSEEQYTFSEEEMNVSELEHKIYTEIEKLPGQCRKIFKMNRFDGMTNSDIAETLNLSKRTVETQISKALKILRGNIYPKMLVLACFLMAL
ncbi:MAG: RNA polymerase sigma-70 factor [Bacteroidales bacterium]|nr:RNA polymerase sigma-70 factor [Bacteroidales bacterium]